MAYYRGFITIGEGRQLPGCDSRSHNAALRNTRRLLSGQGYRAVREESRAGHLVLQRPDGLRAVIDIVMDAAS